MFDVVVVLVLLCMILIVGDVVFVKGLNGVGLVWVVVGFGGGKI